MKECCKELGLGCLLSICVHDFLDLQLASDVRRLETEREENVRHHSNVRNENNEEDGSHLSPAKERRLQMFIAV